MNITTRKLDDKGSKMTRWVVLADGREVGLVEKFKPTRKDLHPFKAFRGIGTACQLAGFFFDASEAAQKGFPLDPTDKVGGFAAAIAAVVQG